MKNLYGIFIKGRGNKFVGPRFGELFTVKDICDDNGRISLEDYRKLVAKSSKRKTIIKKQIWKNI